MPGVKKHVKRAVCSLAVVLICLGQIVPSYAHDAYIEPYVTYMVIGDTYHFEFHGDYQVSRWYITVLGTEDNFVFSVFPYSSATYEATVSADKKTATYKQKIRDGGQSTRYLYVDYVDSDGQVRQSLGCAVNVDSSFPVNRRQNESYFSLLNASLFASYLISWFGSWLGFMASNSAVLVWFVASCALFALKFTRRWF